ncbi:MAG: hypothetical protein H0X30_07880 [Anaerolineae bacterium]|nr:hypothetical protein [Anaerolineae bacterium]
MDEAVKLLEASGWVEKIDDRSADSGMVLWHWSNQSPFNWAKEQFAGFVIISGHVDHIVLDTGFRLGEIRLIFGIPDIEFVKADKSRGEEYATYWANYWQYGLIVLGSQPCNAIQPLFQLVTLSIGQVTKSSANADLSSSNSLYEMPHVC